MNKKGTSSSKFIGRTGHLRDLRRSMDEVEGSRGAAYLISGEAGVGKTSLAGQVEEEAMARDWIVMSGECILGETGEPYFPIVKAIRGHRRGAGAGAGDPDASGEGAPPSTFSLPSGLLGIEGGRGAGDRPSRARSTQEFRMEHDRMFESVSDLVTNISERRPVLMIIDDLHWADNATLQLLYYLIRSSVMNRVLVLGTYRPEEVEGTRGSPLVKFRSRLLHEGLGRSMELERFDREETLAFLEHLVRTDVPSTLVKRIHDDTRGNPFYIREFIRSLEQKGVDMGKDALERELVQGVKRIPSSISSLIMARVERLGEEERRILRQGAVIGQEFDYHLLRRTLEMDEEQVVELLEDLMNNKILTERVAGERVIYRFTHNLIREVIYNSLHRARRRLLHRRAGNVMEEISGDRGHLGDKVFHLAHHFSQTSDLGKAFEYSVLAGERALSAFALGEAQRYLEEALDLLQKNEALEDPEKREAEILTDLGETMMHMGDWRKALQYHRKVLQLCDDDPGRRARALRWIGEIEMNRYEWKKAIDAFQGSLRLCADMGDSRGLAENYRCLAWISFEVGEHDGGLEYVNKTIEEARKVGDTYLMGKALIDLGNSYNVRNEFDRSREQYELALETLDRERDLDQIMRAYNNIGDVHMKREEYGEAIEHFEKVLEISKRTGDLLVRGFSTANIAECLYRMGETGRAKQQVEDALHILRKVDNKFMIGQMCIVKALMAKEEGQPGEAERLLRRAIEIHEEHDIPVGLASSWFEFGLMMKEEGDPDRARRYLERALELYEEMGSRVSTAKVRRELEGL